LQNAEDLLLIAVEMLYERSIWEKSVLNPLNFQLLIMLQHGLPYFPDSMRIQQWLIKIYTKLGLSRIVTKIGKNI